MKVGLVMFYDNNIKEYADINYKINKEYCRIYNIDLIFSNKKYYTNRHSAWERLPLILSYLEKYDYIIWIDADAYFYKDANNITTLIETNPSKDFIFSKDCNGVNINTGVFIVKNSQYSINFIKKWAFDDNLYRSNSYPKWWDQGVLIDMYEKNIMDIQEKSVIYNYGIIQHFRDEDKLNNTYIHHLAGKSSKIRYETSKKYYQTYILETKEKFGIFNIKISK